MKLVIDQNELLAEIKKKGPKIAKEAEKLLLKPITKQILSDAAPIIQSLLRSPSSLPTKDGLLQFYDTQSDAAKAAKNWGIPKNTGDAHLLQMWNVGYNVDEEGGQIIVNNDKLVRGKTSTYYLFDLLWNGTSPYIVPVELTKKEQKAFGKKHGKSALEQWNDLRKVEQLKLERQRAQNKAQEKARGFKRNYHLSAVEQHRRDQAMRANTGQPIAVDRAKAFRIAELTRLAGGGGFESGDFGSSESGGTRHEPLGITQATGKFTRLFRVFIKEQEKPKQEYAPQKMHYYNRFKGKFFYNQIYRKGIEGKTLDDFHEYVATCVYRGLMMAVGETRKGNEAMIVQQLSRSVLKSDSIYSH